LGLVIFYDLVLEKGKRDRSGEEELVSRMLLQILSISMNLESNLEIGFSGNETPQCQSLDHANAVSRLLAGDVIKKDDVIIGILTGRQKEPLLPINYHNDPSNKFARPPKS